LGITLFDWVYLILTMFGTRIPYEQLMKKCGCLEGSNVVSVVI
jgi:hypothetical protein